MTDIVRGRWMALDPGQYSFLIDLPHLQSKPSFSFGANANVNHPGISGSAFTATIREWHWDEVKLIGARVSVSVQGDASLDVDFAFIPQEDASWSEIVSSLREIRDDTA